MIYAEPPQWTEQLLANLEERKKHYEIDQPGKVRAAVIADREFPEVQVEAGPFGKHTGMNRKQRRAKKAQLRKRKSC